MTYITSLTPILGPGLGAFVVAFVFLIWTAPRWRWWEFFVPWFAPITWLWLVHYVPRYPAKSLGNLIEIMGLGLVPAGYLAIRATALRKLPPQVNALTVAAGAIVAAAALYFIIPSFPE